MPPEDGGAPAPAPADPTPAPAPADPTPAPAPAPTDSNPTIQPGQSPTDLDFDTLLDDIDKEIEEEDGTQPPADPNAPDPNNPTPPAPADPNAPPADDPTKNPDGTPKDPQPTPGEPAPLDPTQPVDIDDVERYFSAPEIPELGIKPIGELRNPEAGETANDYFKNVTMPAIMQTVKNMTGFAQHNEQVAQRGEQDAQIQRDQEMVSEIDALIASKAMPAYTKSANGQVDPKSEGGKVIGEVLKLMSEHNSDAKNKAITSFDHGYRALYLPAQEAARKEAEKTAGQQRRSGANAVLNGGGRSGGSPAPNGQPQHIRKGQSVTDLDFDNLV